MISDLQPYTCHIASCQFARAPFPNRNTWVQHLRLAHQFDQISEPIPCPLCLGSIENDRISHLACHLEEISLTILPTNPDSDDELSEGSLSDAEHNSIGRLQSNADSNSSSDELSELAAAAKPAASDMIEKLFAKYGNNWWSPEVPPQSPRLRPLENYIINAKRTGGVLLTREGLLEKLKSIDKGAAETIPPWFEELLLENDIDGINSPTEQDAKPKHGFESEFREPWSQDSMFEDLDGLGDGSLPAEQNAKPKLSDVADVSNPPSRQGEVLEPQAPASQEITDPALVELDVQSGARASRACDECWSRRRYCSKNLPACRGCAYRSVECHYPADGVVSRSIKQNLSQQTSLKVCVECRRARRYCSKDRPTCHNCNLRGLKCRYPTTKDVNQTSSPSLDDSIKTEVIQLVPNVKCSECKKSRRYCPGGQPCQGCISRGLECIYPTSKSGDWGFENSDAFSPDNASSIPKRISRPSPADQAWYNMATYNAEVPLSAQGMESRQDDNAPQRSDERHSLPPVSLIDPLGREGLAPPDLVMPNPDLPAFRELLDVPSPPMVPISGPVDEKLDHSSYTPQSGSTPSQSEESRSARGDGLYRSTFPPVSKKKQLDLYGRLHAHGEARLALSLAAEARPARSDNLYHCMVAGCQYPPFPTKRGLDSHITKVHPYSGVPPMRVPLSESRPAYLCTVEGCLYPPFDTKRSLDHHTAIAHTHREALPTPGQPAEPRPARSNGPYICTVVGCQHPLFSTQEDLDFHSDYFH